MPSLRLLLTSLVWSVLVGLAACGGDAARTPKSIVVDPGSPRIPAGTTVDVAASYRNSDATTNAAADVTWSTGDASIATVTPGVGGHATVKGIKVGTTTVTAAGSGLTGSTMVTVTAATLTSIGVTPMEPSLAAGTSSQLTATGVFSDATTMNLSTQVTWSTSAVGIATVDGSGLLRGVATGTAKITASMGSASGSTNVTITSAVLRSIEVAPLDPSLAAGLKQQLTATGVFSDGSKQNLTADVTWSSGAENEATVTPAGLVTAVAVGTATITATKGAISGSTHVTVTVAVLASIAIDPPAPRVPLGQFRDLTATGTLTDGTTQDLTTQVTWTSGTEAVATINAAGHVSTVTTGTSAITAELAGITGSTTLTVTPAVLVAIDVDPTTPDLPLGRTLQFTATGRFSDSTTQDLTTQVAWASSDEAIATISNAADSRGLALARAVGPTTISATSGTIVGSTVLTATAAVLVAIDVTPAMPSLALGRTLQFTATGRFSDTTTQNLTAAVTWASSSALIASISNAPDLEGQATALAVGDTTVSASLAVASGTVTGSTQLSVTDAVLDSIDVTPTAPELALGHALRFTATGVFSNHTNQNLTTQVTWTSSDTAVATISNADDSQGLATSAHTGTTTIAATLPGEVPVTGSTTLTVTPALLVSIQVTPINPSIAASTTLPFIATGTFTDTTTQNITDQVTWASSDPAVATISTADPGRGLATGVTPGTTTISATKGTISGETVLTVTDAPLISIQVTPVAPSLAKGRSLSFIAIGTFGDTSTQDLTTQVAWASSDPAVAAISNAPGSEGKATALAEGTTTISAALGLISGSTLLTVTPAVLVSITVEPPTPSLAVGRQLSFTATGTFSDASQQDLTTQVTWASSDPAIAVVSNAADSEGQATALAVGTTAISATAVTVAGPVSGSTSLTVSPAVLERIVVTPADSTIAKGRPQQYSAQGFFSDGTDQILTTQVTWASSNEAVAQISNALGSEGVASSLALGTTTISAALDGVTGSTSMTVGAASLDSIAVTPLAASLAPGGTKQYTATGTFSDTTTLDLTTQVTWSSMNTVAAQISNAPGSQGLATALAEGATTISATLLTVTGSASLTVTLTLACDPLANPANGTVAVSNGGVFPSTARYACNAGFALGGSELRSCGPDGTWSGAAPVCTTEAVMLTRVGNGTTTLGNGSIDAALEERLVSDGSVIRTIALPTATSGAQSAFTLAGNATTEGGASLSANGRFVIFAGYSSGPGVANINQSTNRATDTAPVKRVVARVSLAGEVDTSTLLLDAFSAGSVRGAASVDGTGFWASGTSSGVTGGAHFVAFGSTGSTTRILAVPDNSRNIHVFEGQLYGSSASGASAGVYAIGSGLPTTVGQVISALKVTGGNVQSFAVLDRNPAVAGPDVIYVAIDANAPAGRINIQKWMFDGTTWTLVTAFAPTFTTATGARGLTAYIVDTGVRIVATTSETTSHVVKLTDDGVNTTPAATTIVSPGTNFAYRGVVRSPYAP